MCRVKEEGGIAFLISDLVAGDNNKDAQDHVLRWRRRQEGRRTLKEVSKISEEEELIRRRRSSSGSCSTKGG